MADGKASTLGGSGQKIAHTEFGRANAAEKQRSLTIGSSGGLGSPAGRCEEGPSKAGGCPNCTQKRGDAQMPSEAAPHRRCPRAPASSRASQVLSGCGSSRPQLFWPRLCCRSVRVQAFVPTAVRKVGGIPLRGGPHLRHQPFRIGTGARVPEAIHRGRGFYSIGEE